MRQIRHRPPEPTTVERLFLEESVWRVTGCRDCIFILDCIDKRQGPEVGHRCYTPASQVDGDDERRF